MKPSVGSINILRPSTSSAKHLSRGVVLVELLILVAIVVVLITMLFGYFTTVKTTVSLAGTWVAPTVTIVGPQPFSVKYKVGLKETITVTPPIGSPTVTTTNIALPAGSASVTFSLIGANGAAFVSGSRQYTMVIGTNNTADINMVAVAKGTDLIQATVNYNGGIYPDTQILQFETHNP